jgi:hypothetical protein
MGVAVTPARGLRFFMLSLFYMVLIWWAIMALAKE